MGFFLNAVNVTPELEKSVAEDDVASKEYLESLHALNVKLVFLNAHKEVETGAKKTDGNCKLHAFCLEYNLPTECFEREHAPCWLNVSN
jgi:hypothetical protein